MVQTMNSVEEDFKQKFRGKRGLKQKNTHKCDAVLDFVSIVSRAGTDISAALDRLNSSGVHKPVVLVVLHPTFDYEKVVPDSNYAVNRDNTFAVDCLFNEDDGLLKCPKNEEAYEEIAKYLKFNNLTSYAYYKDLPSPYPSSDSDETDRGRKLVCLRQTVLMSLLRNTKMLKRKVIYNSCLLYLSANIETSPLIHSTEDSLYRKILTHKYWVLIIVMLVLIVLFVMLADFNII
ncbi:uncharacterized protein LOC130419536 isoform X1 [Triplophysa dalaica]|uniref:uncharacterized protein LOC130419536 isoform X1 n=1 Tax=Triplophysa dalaica TaxID=1582913 RepID=UPI0024E01C24|nr:uncharacterized protein LOC130419536 isoform X1 [Triplophysa dalaica]XP_056602336.1 uncharacterized protein LOC130419536 isoform X1 [Triplophysa dalaica]XP_056602337.1 uncharacterized protein LOC130419536 isoform X1 [Triplophysa dalaica]XP_056602338.1 uncharacterized protein LOC130419536 isoform X1 [Triplophysa dalaica]XP_056602339.1 uncharacterized protein LOC130419536 isoform X1 [Triplophysa dalaica]